MTNFKTYEEFIHEAKKLYLDTMIEDIEYAMYHNLKLPAWKKWLNIYKI